MTRWIAAAGAFVVSLDSMVNIAFPAMAAWFHLAPESVRWVIVFYVLTYSIMSFVAGAVADRVGHARVFRAGLAGSAVAYVVVATAPAFGWLLVGRVLQGVAGGLVYGTAPGLTTLAAPVAERGRALGFLNSAMGLGLAGGPIVGGVLVRSLGWQAVFAARVPLAIVVLAAAAWQLPRGAPAATHRGVRLGDVARVTVLHPSALSFLANAGIFSIWLLAPFYLVDMRALGPVVGGLLFMLTPLGTTLAAPMAGRLVDRAGTRLPLIVGLAAEAAGLAALSRAGDATSEWIVAASLFTAGLGLGLFQVPNMTEVMNAFPAGQQGAAGGLSVTARTLGVVSGVSAFSAVFAARRARAGIEAGFETAFAAAAVVVGCAALAATVRRAQKD